MRLRMETRAHQESNWVCRTGNRFRGNPFDWIQGPRRVVWL